jgi:DnaJ family protein C protein 8
MDLLPGIPDSDIKKRYRERSLLIHPDKCHHPQAPVAFDRLKTAQEGLLDEKKRALLDEAIADARMLLIRKHKWTVDSPELQEEEFIPEWRDKTREVLVEEELRRRRRRQAEMREEGRQKAKEEAEMEERRKKREWEAEWERTRDDRIDSWRDFVEGRAKGEKRKHHDAENGASNGVNGEAKLNGVVDGRVEKKKKKEKKLKVLG